MSYYEDERDRTRSQRERSRYDSYEDDSTYSPRGYDKNTTLIKRRDSYDDVDEEITRDFSPPDGRGGYIRETTIRRSGVRPARARSFDEDRFLDDRYDDGAFVGARHDHRYRDDRRGRDRDRDRYRGYGSDYSSRSRSRTPPRRERRKSRVDETLDSLGIGGLVGAILGKDSKDRASSRGRYRSRSRSGRDRAYSETRSGHRSRSRGTTREQVIQAVKAAVLAGAGEAFRSRKEAGGFDGEKGKRILTAALTAGGVDGFVNSNKDPERHKLRDTIGSAVAGIATSRIVNGPRSRSRGRGGSPNSRRGRSQSRGGVSDLLAGGAVAAAAKKVYDNVRSRSRGRSVSTSRRSDDDRAPVRSRSRRRSLSQAAARGLASLGLNGAADKVDPGRQRELRGSRRRDTRDYNDRSGYDDDDYYEDDVGQPRSGEVNGRARSLSRSGSDRRVGKDENPTRGGYSLDFGARHNGDPDTDSDSDLGSSSGEEKEVKKNRNKWLVTSGLATIATIHAGNEVYQSYEKHRARTAAVEEGKISPEQAKKKQNTERLKEAASIGIAALGLKGAYSEWKEMREHRGEYNEQLEKFKRHQNKRQARREKFYRHQKQGYSDSGYASSMPNLNSPPPMSPPPGGWNHTQPFADDRVAQEAGRTQYYDDNPYHGYSARGADDFDDSAFPHPPVGSDHAPIEQGPRPRSMSRRR